MSTLTVSNVSDGSLSIPTTYVTNGSAKAWVNFNGTGTVATRDSLNVSSLTDNGTGDYTINFTSSLANGNYTSTHMVAQLDADGAGTGSVDWLIYYSQTTAALRVTAGNGASTSADMFYVALSVNGDLA